MIKHRIVFILVASLLFLSTTTLNASANNFDIKIKPLPSPIIEYIDTYNFHKVDNFYYRGGQPDRDDFENFALLGIKTIINLRNTDEEDIADQKKMANKFDINYISIPMKASQPPTVEQIKYFFEVINNPENLPVYVHCWQGKDRTGIMTALYRVKNYGWNFDQAYSEMKKKGYHSFFYPKQKEFLYNYTKKYLSENY